MEVLQIERFNLRVTVNRWSFCWGWGYSYCLVFLLTILTSIDYYGTSWIRSLVKKHGSLLFLKNEKWNESKHSRVIEIQDGLSCRTYGIHVWYFKTICVPFNVPFNMVLWKELLQKISDELFFCFFFIFFLNFNFSSCESHCCKISVINFCFLNLIY